MDEPVVDNALAAWAIWERRRTATRAGWRRIAFPGLFLIFLGQTAGGVAKHAHGLGAALGYALIITFCALYLWALPTAWARGYGRRFWSITATMIGIYVVESFFAQSDAYVMAIFITVLFVVALPRYWLVAMLFFTLTAMYVPLLIPSWDMGVNYGAAFALPITAVAMYGFFKVMQSNHELAEMRTELVRLAAENERTRIARDLHDVLGHSLTTITVKASLANRLAEREPERAAAEIAQVERLARSALADVRATINGYRAVNLASELASGREVMRAVGITAVFPTAVDTARPEHHELFGWVVRESLTNVVRHSRARTCTIELGPDSVEIFDDGVGGPPIVGSGLTGLRERVATAHGTVTAGPSPNGGWHVRVDVPPTNPGAEPAEPAPASDNQGHAARGGPPIGPLMLREPSSAPTTR